MTLLHVEPFGGPLTLRSENGELTLGRPAAGAIRVSALPEAASGATPGEA